MNIDQLMKYSTSAITVLSKALDSFNAKYPEGSELNIPFTTEGIVDTYIVNISSTGIVLKQKYGESEYYGLKLDNISGEKTPYEFWVPNNIESWKTNINKRDERNLPLVQNNEKRIDVFYYYSTAQFPEEIYLNSEVHEDIESFFFQLSLVQDIMPVQMFRDEINLAKEISDMLPEFSVLYGSRALPENVYKEFISIVKGLNI
ncbi:TPA: hypothetical protein NV937_000690 [Escherichia coli]|nr:hypothetical protein [Escherichia coli]